MKIDKNRKVKFMFFDVPKKVFNSSNRARKMLTKCFRINNSVINSKVHRSIK